MAKYGVDCVRNGKMKALKANGIINVVLGVAAVIAVIVVSTVIKNRYTNLMNGQKWC